MNDKGVPEMDRINMMGRWKGLREFTTNDGKGQAYMQPGGTDITYHKAAAFLNDGPVEDWGCGTCYAKQFFTHPYTGVDGTDDYADVVADLRTYTSKTHGILLRHVLEHNFEWRDILKNALASCEKLVIVLFMPFADQTRVDFYSIGGIPTQVFRKEDITQLLPQYVEEAVETETVLYVNVTGK